MLWTLHYVCQKPYCIVSGPEVPIDAKPVEVVSVDALVSDAALDAAEDAVAASLPDGTLNETAIEEVAQAAIRAALAIASSENEVQS